MPARKRAKPAPPPTRRLFVYGDDPVHAQEKTFPDVVLSGVYDDAASALEEAKAYLDETNEERSQIVYELVPRSRVERQASFAVSDLS